MRVRFVLVINDVLFPFAVAALILICISLAIYTIELPVFSILSIFILLSIALQVIRDFINEWFRDGLAERHSENGILDIGHLQHPVVYRKSIRCQRARSPMRLNRTIYCKKNFCEELWVRSLKSAVHDAICIHVVRPFFQKLGGVATITKTKLDNCVKVLGHPDQIHKSIRNVEFLL